MKIHRQDKIEFMLSEINDWTVGQLVSKACMEMSSEKVWNLTTENLLVIVKNIYREELSKCSDSYIDKLFQDKEAYLNE